MTVARCSVREEIFYTSLLCPIAWMQGNDEAPEWETSFMHEYLMSSFSLQISLSFFLYHQAHLALSTLLLFILLACDTSLYIWYAHAFVHTLPQLEACSTYLSIPFASSILLRSPMTPHLSQHTMMASGLWVMTSTGLSTSLPTQCVGPSTESLTSWGWRTPFDTHWWLQLHEP